ncbi:MAG: CHAT domain-containing protein [Methanosarcina sp.]
MKVGDSEKAWEYLGRFKSRSLLEALRLLKLEAPESIPEEFIYQEEKHLSSIREFIGLIRNATKADEIYQLTRRVKEIEAELDEVYNRIREFSPEYVDLSKGQPLRIEEVKRLIESQTKKTAFVEYYTTDEKVFIFVMRSDEKYAKVETTDLSSYELLDYLNRYYTEIVDMPMPDTEETWQELSRKLIEPIFSYIDGCELVYLIPFGLLHYLPLHALFVKDKRFDKKKRLIEYFPIVYVPNLTVLKYAQSRDSQCLKPCLSLGYTPHDDQKELFEGEAVLVAEQFNVEPILGDQAKSDVLKNVSSDVVHASCHGRFDPKEPLNSGLCLKDGILTARKIFDMSIKTNLLVLSACQTGLNSRKPGDDLLGLTRAFLYAGARSLIVSLWSVEAKSTFEYMKSLYIELKEGTDKAKAVQNIQIDFINGKYGDFYSHPYFWAPFTLIGDWK